MSTLVVIAKHDIVKFDKIVIFETQYDRLIGKVKTDNLKSCACNSISP